MVELSDVIFAVFLVLFFLGGSQKLQFYLWTNDIKAKLGLIDAMRREAEKKTLDYMIRHRARDAERLLERVKNFFVISPVDIEPTDIIRRLEHLVVLRERLFREDFRRHMPEAGEVERSLAESAAMAVHGLDLLHKYIKHMLLTARKTGNLVVLVALRAIMPQAMEVAEALSKAVDVFLRGEPIGDSVGPMVALRLAGYDAEWRLVNEDTVAAEAELEGRRLILVKAKGPESNVGRPGLATQRIVEELAENGVKPAMIITVDAAAKLESEETGAVAEGVGAAIGDKGPEKIRFERVAAQYNIPLRAVIVKMDMKEAITGMTEKLKESVDKAVELVRDIILRDTEPGDTVIVVGVGNSIGVGQKLAAG